MELSPGTLDKLLSAFDQDPECAAEKLMTARRKLVKFFEWRGCVTPEELADETIDRVCKKLAHGESIQNPATYLFGVARNVVLENWKEQQKDRIRIAADVDPDTLGTEDDFVQRKEYDEEWLHRLNALRDCLHQLPQEARSLILRYYQLDRGQKIDNRKKISEQYGIELNALRIRVHRIRMKLEGCVRERMSSRFADGRTKYISKEDSMSKRES